MSAVIEGASTDAELRAAAEREAGFVSRLLRQPLTVVSGRRAPDRRRGHRVRAPAGSDRAARAGPAAHLRQAFRGPPARHRSARSRHPQPDALRRPGDLARGRRRQSRCARCSACCSVSRRARWLAGSEFVVMRVCDVLLAVPGLVILLVVLAIFGQNESAAMVTLGHHHVADTDAGRLLRDHRCSGGALRSGRPRGGSQQLANHAAAHPACRRRTRSDTDQPRRCPRLPGRGRDRVPRSRGFAAEPELGEHGHGRAASDRPGTRGCWCRPAGSSPSSHWR